MLIDVDEERIVQVFEPCRYIALSYAWGVVADVFETTLVNITQLEDPDGLKAFENEMPQTMKDAIALAEILGERYIWIDRLCVIQDGLRS
jgi:hypothetical protein